jgi:hypothetical protein
MLMMLAMERGVAQFQILGGSKLIIKWESGKRNMQNMLLIPIVERITKLKGKFNFFSFQHVYRELNIEVVPLSK